LASLEGREVLGAILTLTQDSRNVNNGFLQLARVTEPWTTDTLSFDQDVDDMFRFGDTNTPEVEDDKSSWIDVTDIVRDWVSGEAENHGFRLAFDEQSFVIADFHAAGEFAPQLIVTTAVPEPGAWLLLMAALACGLLLRRRGEGKA
ncbi:MAG: DNRLRE domain-containing protein, partial [Thermoguttaceae bacterium]